MKKNAIIDIVINDLSDIQTLITTFKTSETIPAPFLDALQSRYQGLGKSIALLDFWKESAESKNDNKVAKAEKPIEKQPEPVTVTEPKPIVKVEPQPEVEAKVDITEKVAEPQQNITVEKPVKVEPKPTPKAKQKTSIVKDTINHGADIINYGAPVSSVGKAFSINDRVLYQRELYAGNNAALNADLAAIDTLGSYDEALAYLLQSHTDWDETDTTVSGFLHLIHRRFI